MEHFAALGATVFATDIADDFSGPATYQKFNLLDEDGLASAVSWIGEIKPDILFNNAAIFDMGSVLEADLEQYDRLFGVNVRAFYAVMQAAAKSMVANKQAGSIITKWAKKILSMRKTTYKLDTKKVKLSKKQLERQRALD